MNLIVEKGLSQESSLRLYPDISEFEMFAIGKMTAAWALLEHRIIQMVLFMAEHAQHPLPENFVSTSTLSTTLDAFKFLVSKAPNEEAKKYLEGILQRVQNLKSERHRLTHGLYQWMPENPTKVTVSTPKKQRATKQEYDSNRIIKLVEKIGQLNFELFYPGGEDEFMEEKARQGSYISRSFSILLTGSETSDRSLKVGGRADKE